MARKHWAPEPSDEELIAARLSELEAADAAGRLWELVRDTPPIEEQVKPILDRHYP